MNKPLILDLKCNSLDDGPGIRTAIFFKGCPLNCVWCHNPESKKIYNEIAFDATTCIGCGQCVLACKEKALDKNNKYYIDRGKCTLCYACVDTCPSKALTRVGKEMEIEELVKKALSDKTFYDVSGGGVTLSGGEATMYPEWVGALAKKLNENKIKVLMETCALFDYKKVSEHMFPYINEIYCDFKIFDEELHKKYCGVSNNLIKENIKKMISESREGCFSLLLRVPLIPNITDTDDNLEKIAAFMAEHGITKTELLPYNSTWYGKNDKIGIELCDELKGVDKWQSEEQMKHMKKIFISKGIEC